MELTNTEGVYYSPLRNLFRAWGLLFVLLLLSVTSTFGQTWGEFFNQKKTQKRYLLEQIAALQVYIVYAKKGYEIVGSGINTVKDFKNGEFSLHNSFFTSLKAVNPSIAGQTRVTEIIALQLSINKTFTNLKTGNILPQIDLLYIQDVKANIIDECMKDLEELLLVITSGHTEMKDDERFKRLDKVYEAMIDKSGFAQSFCNEVNLLIRKKEQEQQEINKMRRLYENR
jgi:hypothetical protein